MVGSATNLSSMEFHIVRTVAAALACLQAARLAARVSDGKRIRGIVRKMRYTNWHLYLFTFYRCAIQIKNLVFVY